MNDEIYERLSLLFERLGINHEGGSVQNAEICGYSAGARLAKTAADGLFANLFIDTAGETGLSMLLSTVGEAKRETDEESRRAVISAFSGGGSFASADDFKNAVKAVDPDVQYDAYGGKLNLIYSSGVDREFFKRLKYFIKGYLPACYILKLCGDGLEWNMIEELNMSWQEIDGYKFPFSVWDTMKM